MWARFLDCPGTRGPHVAAPRGDGVGADDQRVWRSVDVLGQEAVRHAAANRPSVLLELFVVAGKQKIVRKKTELLEETKF